MQIPNHPDWPEWERIIYHEAGHAALSMKLWDQPAPIVVIKSTDEDGKPRKGGRYKVQIKMEISSEDQTNPKKKHVLQMVMVCAAGGVTELIKFGDESKGFRKDKSQIDRIILATQDQEAMNERDKKYQRTHEEVTSATLPLKQLPRRR